MNFYNRFKIQVVYLLITMLFIYQWSYANKVITLNKLLDEMISFQAKASYPAPTYTCKQVSSYDRRSISPDHDYWFANNDGSGYIRMDTIGNRKEKVLFDADGPGVVTRIWMTTLIKNGVLRFYFDGESIPRFEVPAYDMKQAPFYTGNALSLVHTHYERDGRGGNTFFLPLPYQKKCKITFEDPDSTNSVPRYYQINYRTYTRNTTIETFRLESVRKSRSKIEKVNYLLMHPESFKKGIENQKNKNLNAHESIKMDLPIGKNAVRDLKIKVECDSAYAQVMRGLILMISFDNVQTVRVPLSDFSGGGMGAPKVNSYFLSADGNGCLISRWVMPYKTNAKIEVENLNNMPARVYINARTSKFRWNKNTLYFHVSWKQQRDIPVNNNYDSNENIEWNFATIDGRGVYRGDLLSVYNYTPEWYGEGDEKIWVDNDTFPSHFGTGTEDYYNCSWAPVVTFDTPFGGAPRADKSSSNGYNAFLRTRNLDDIPFGYKFCFNIEMLSWHPGKVNYASTIFWYGDINAKALNTSSNEEAIYRLP